VGESSLAILLVGSEIHCGEIFVNRIALGIGLISIITFATFASAQMTGGVKIPPKQATVETQSNTSGNSVENVNSAQNQGTATGVKTAPQSQGNTSPNAARHAPGPSGKGSRGHRTPN
jgi:hypothetical protein